MEYTAAAVVYTAAAVVYTAAAVVYTAAAVVYTAAAVAKKQNKKNNQQTINKPTKPANQHTSKPGN